MSLVGADLLAGRNSGWWSIVNTAGHHQTPGDAGELVGQRDSHQLWWLSLKKGGEPRRRLVTSRSDVAQQSRRADDEG